MLKNRLQKAGQQQNKTEAKKLPFCLRKKKNRPSQIQKIQHINEERENSNRQKLSAVKYSYFGFVRESESPSEVQ